MKTLKRHKIDLKDTEQVEDAYWDDDLHCSKSQKSDILHALCRQDKERAKHRRQYERQQKKKQGDKNNACIKKDKDKITTS